MKLIWQPAAVAALALSALLPQAGGLQEVGTPPVEATAPASEGGLCGSAAVTPIVTWNNCTGSGELIWVDLQTLADYLQCMPPGLHGVGSAGSVKTLQRIGAC